MGSSRNLRGSPVWGGLSPIDVLSYAWVFYIYYRKRYAVAWGQRRPHGGARRVGPVGPTSTKHRGAKMK